MGARLVVVVVMVVMAAVVVTPVSCICSKAEDEFKVGGGDSLVVGR